MADPPPTYQDVARTLALPIGSIGPTRQRCLAQLRTMLARTPGFTAGSGRPAAGEGTAPAGYWAPATIRSTG